MMRSGGHQAAGRYVHLARREQAFGDDGEFRRATGRRRYHMIAVDWRRCGHAPLSIRRYFAGRHSHDDGGVAHAQAMPSHWADSPLRAFNTISISWRSACQPPMTPQ